MMANLTDPELTLEEALGLAPRAIYMIPEGNLSREGYVDSASRVRPEHDLDKILADDLAFYARSKGAYGGGERGGERAQADLEARLARTRMTPQETEALGMQEAADWMSGKLQGRFHAPPSTVAGAAAVGKYESERQKAAIEAAGKAPRSKTAWDVAEGMAREDRIKKGLAGDPSYDDINEAAGRIKLEEALGRGRGTNLVPPAISPKQQDEIRDRGIRMNQTRAVLDPKIWGPAMQSWGAPGYSSGILGNLLEATGNLPTELQMLYTVIDKMALKERHEMFGSALSTGEQVLARTIIPNRRMHPAKLQSVLRMNLDLDEWAEAFEAQMADTPRNSAEWQKKAEQFRKDYPFPITDAAAAAYGEPGQTPQRAVGAKGLAKDGTPVTWDGQRWVGQ